jgi:hypothetical protein
LVNSPKLVISTGKNPFYAGISQKNAFLRYEKAYPQLRLVNNPH